MQTTPTTRSPWRIEAKITPFHPYRTIVPYVSTLEHAVKLAALKKQNGRLYATRIRAN